MKVTKEDVLKVASLASIEITQEECNALTKDLQAIIIFADKLEELDTQDIDMALYVGEQYNVFRQDIIKESYDRDELLKNAPEKYAGCFSVPRVVE